MKTINKTVLMAVFISSASALNIIEWMIPNPMPWIKLGLANLFTVISIVLFGPVFALKVTLGRLLLVSFLTGSFLSPVFFISSSAAIVSLTVMAVAYRPFGKIGPVGISVLGAVTHNITQLITVYFIIVLHPAVFLLTPLLLCTGSIAGLVNGLLAKKIILEFAYMSDKRILLASRSPRRIAMLKKLGIPFVSFDSGASETKVFPDESAEDYSMRMCKLKLSSALEKSEAPGVLIVSDTVVEKDGTVFGKPRDPSDAASMLRELSDSVQKVHTSVIAKDLSTSESCSATETTLLKMRALSPEDIEYLKDKHLDKAGGYAIQGMKDTHFEWIKGNYDNVVGFPLGTVRRLVRKVQE